MMRYIKILISMKTIKKPVQSEINIKKSQFICCLFPTKNKRESKEIIQKLNQKYNDIVKTIFQKYFKPLHYKKESGNFRFIQEDGLGKIVNFQRSWCNNKDSCSFIINVGIITSL